MIICVKAVYLSLFGGLTALSSKRNGFSFLSTMYIFKVQQGMEIERELLCLLRIFAVCRRFFVG
jgi:hypothetical protein